MIVDDGARGHALANAYLENKDVRKVIVAPGNEGMRDDFINEQKSGRYRNMLIPDARGQLKNPKTILALAREYKPDLIDIAQDDALSLGTVDLLQKEGFRVFGPTQDSAQIEWDKVWAREFMTRQGIQTPEYRAFSINEDSVPYALDLLRRHEKVFFKAAGLYAGKGVVDAHDETSAQAALAELRKMGSAAQRYLVEAGLKGEEFSYYAIVDGSNFLSFPSAQDNKRAFNGDKGKNTGGMGANSPALVTSGLEERIVREIIRPAVLGLTKEGRPYKGILYLGGIYDSTAGVIGVIEFNSRWGDPESQVILPGIAVNEGSTDYLTLVNDALAGNLNKSGFSMGGLSRVCIVGACRGYPEDYSRVLGQRLRIDYRHLPKNVHLLSAGAGVRDGKLYAAGGRVFNCVASGEDVIEARRTALQAMACCLIDGNGLHYRSDIAWRDIERLCSMKESE